MNYPMREKYIDEIVGGIWFIFGEHIDGKVDIADANGDVLTHLTKETAKRLIEIRDEFLRSIYEVIGYDAQNKKAKIKRLYRCNKIGSLVLVSRWSDAHSSDPYSIGWLESAKDGYYKVVRNNRWYHHCWEITNEEVFYILKNLEKIDNKNVDLLQLIRDIRNERIKIHE